MTANSSKLSKDLLNKRIQFEDLFATVRYVGPVPPTKGDWLGVEWDIASRGKHNGTHEGVCYFTCSVPNSGSFIRFSSKIHLGRSFLAALIDKYASNHEGTSKGPPNDDDMEYDAQKDLDLLYWAGNKKIEVEVLGLEKIRRTQRHLDRLSEVGLTFEQISNAGLPGEIEAACLNIVDLNLSKNLIPDWTIVACICEQLKKLTVLRLNYNRFQILKETPNFGNVFNYLTGLSLNYTLIQWKQIQLLEPCFRNLENLQLGFNNIHNLGDDKDVLNTNCDVEQLEKIKGFDNLKTINLESNAIANWNEIARLSQLPSLEVLYLNENAINEIIYAGDEESDFPRLRYLNINDNKIQGWQSIDQLNKFPALKELRVKKNPFLEGVKEDEAGIAIIARIKQLTLFNGSTILPVHRADAERYYLRLIVRDLKSPQEIQKQHPRYNELCEIHGTPEFDEKSLKATSNILKDRLLALTITSRRTLDDPPIKKVSKKLLGTMTIRNLKNLLQKLFAIPTSRQRLFYLEKSEETEGTPVDNSIFAVEMKDELRQLSYYDISSGDEIVILTE